MENQIEKLTFKNIIMSIGALPSSYVDSMSYYETLVWLCNYLQETVIPTINNNGQAVEELQSAYVTLQNYIEHYFDNLDVQEEINKKLDEMALNGTLTTLISGYIDPIMSEYQEQIDSQIATMVANIQSINDKVESATSSTPAGVYETVSDLTTADPSHDYTYVVSATGYWYYYDTTSETWEAGGLYQASEDSVALQDCTTAINSTMNRHASTNLYNPSITKESGYWAITTGNPASNDSYFRTVDYIPIPLDATKLVFGFYLQSTGAFYGNDTALVCFYDNAKQFISGDTNHIIDIPTGAKYFRFSSLKAFDVNYSETYETMVTAGNTHPATFDGFYPTYYTIKDSAISNLITYHHITVKPTGLADYSTVQEALESITDSNWNNRYIVDIYEGEYDLGSDFTADNIADINFKGIVIPNFVTLNGVGDKENVILSVELDERNSHISTLNIYDNCEIKNLTVLGTKTRYAIHDDFSNYDRTITNPKENREQLIENCIIKGIDTYYNVTFGAGTRDQSQWIFKNTVFDGTEAAQNSAQGLAFTVHNSQFGVRNRFITFENCRFLGTRQQGIVLFKTISASANNMMTYITTKGSKYGTGSNSQIGIVLQEENAALYGEGCLYYVTGFYNIIHGIDIQHSDEHDYSDRISLI